MKFAKGVVSVLHKMKKIEKPGVCVFFFFGRLFVQQIINLSDDVQQISYS